MNLGSREDDSYSDDDDDVLIETAMILVKAAGYLCECSGGESTSLQ